MREFTITPNWPSSYGVDFGFVRPFCLLIQVSPAGQPFVFGEYAPEEVPSPEFAQGILRYQQELFASEGVEMALPMGPMYSDPAGKARNMQTSRSEFDVMVAAGFRPFGVPSSVRDGCDLMINSVAHPDIPLIVHPRCVKLIRALTQMPPDKDAARRLPAEAPRVLPPARRAALLVREQPWAPRGVRAAAAATPEPAVADLLAKCT